MNLYYDVRHPRWYKRPDWFLVVGVPSMMKQTVGYVIWQGRELIRWWWLSCSLTRTEEEDLGENVRSEDLIQVPAAESNQAEESRRIKKLVK